jgi:hypothetical protein
MPERTYSTTTRCGSRNTLSAVPFVCDTVYLSKPRYSIRRFPSARRSGRAPVHPPGSRLTPVTGPHDGRTGHGDPIPEIGRFSESELQRRGDTFSGPGRPDVTERAQVRTRLAKRLHLFTHLGEGREEDPDVARLRRLLRVGRAGEAQTQDQERWTRDTISRRSTIGNRSVSA